jgi:putative nucleotidyltransferase with HDIG domain
MSKPGKRKIDFKSDKVIRFFIGFVTVIIITALFPQYETIEADYSIGSIWSKEDLISPFSFPIYKSAADYKSEVDKARSEVLPLFDINNSKSAGQINWLDSLNRMFAGFKRVIDYDNELNKEKSLPEEKRTTNDKELSKLKEELKISFSDEEWRTLENIYNNSNPAVNFDAFKKKVIQSLNQVSDKKNIDIPKSDIKTKQISYYKNKVEESLDLSAVRDMNETELALRADLQGYFKSDEITAVALKIAKQFIVPDFRFNKAETEKITNGVIESVPKTFGIVKENERIVSKHEQINDLTKLKLDSYKRVRTEQMGSNDFYSQQAGRFLFVTIMIALLAIFLYKMRSAVFNDNSKLILLSTILLLQAIFAYLSLNVKANYPIEYLIFVPVAAMLLTVIFDSRLAVYATIIICVLISALRGGDYDIFVPNFCASILVVYSVRDIKNRSQLFVSMIYIFGGYFVATMAIGLERFDSFSMIREKIYISTLNAVLSPILAYGLLIFYEKVFRVATDLVFLELSDFNHPLLRELSAKAPGTFHHSIIVGNLSEQAAEEIGANHILTRVGCYYHDIGKMVSPGYFIENQMDGNKHEELNPSLSAKMIISHVRNGIRLAEKYHLPKEIIDFIPMHHGTNLVSYFYEKARTEEGEMDTTHDFIYRYPGPKPQTKETGIVMLADAVEAATRAIEDPTPAKLETQIDEIIKNRFIEGELDECDLTLRDLIKIKQSFLKTVVGIHHHRIKYPETADEEES